ncbi:hypothetical protein, variant [Blastomyces dermatitidis ATCC 18188]|uniref:Uncharacterized protein n=1 Tax=Ajellomyces dermatitidis (strain ATCC 18188 / CBS 674.68) TaxID=653446 RepID=F2T9I8_AJEDA|nr:hypothetical protein BDDG_02842 [Blastomyces dermatitidis ATCC 18188]KMW67135.1 hypothetical protein, variant [Blastomyces dermatitidis ATCC 18188]
MVPVYLPPGMSYLLGGPKIRILHASTQDATPQPIYDTYPLWLATHFSYYIKDCFPAKHEPTVARKGCNGTNAVTIYGGVAQAHLVVFRWMLACCKGARHGYAKIDRLPFAKYTRILEAAEILDVYAVQDDMWVRMNRMADKQIYIDDVRMVYANFPKSAPVRMLVIRSIGDALFERRLRNFGAYKAFKAECAEYEADIYEYLLERRREVYVEQQWAARAARAAAAAARKANKADQKARAKTGVGGAQESRQAGAKGTPRTAVAGPHRGNK